MPRQAVQHSAVQVQSPLERDADAAQLLQPAEQGQRRQSEVDVWLRRISLGRRAAGPPGCKAFLRRCQQLVGAQKASLVVAALLHWHCCHRSQALLKEVGGRQRRGVGVGGHQTRRCLCTRHADVLQTVVAVRTGALERCTARG